MLKHFHPTSCTQTYLESAEYSRILSAAVINSNFRSILLKDPVKAVSGGYSGERFNLRSEAKQRLAGIHASSLAEFAARLSEI